MKISFVPSHIVELKFDENRKLNFDDFYFV